MPVIAVFVFSLKYSQENKAAPTRGKNDRCLKHGVIATVISENGCHRVRDICFLQGFLDIPGRDMGTSRGIGIPPPREILGGIKEEGTAKADNDKTDLFQSFVLLVVLNTAATKNMVLTPAPTEASVKATSTDPMMDHRRHIIKLYAPKRIAQPRRSFTVMAAMAQTITRVRIKISSCGIMSLSSLCHKFLLSRV
jgi:hypothetical protein